MPHVLQTIVELQDRPLAPALSVRAHGRRWPSLFAMLAGLLAAHATASAADRCPGGTVGCLASAERYRNVAALGDTTGPFCSAAYIGTGAVLTSARCGGEVKASLESRTQPSVLFGTNLDAPDHRLPVLAVTAYPQPSPTCAPAYDKCGSDLALVRFQEPEGEHGPFVAAARQLEDLALVAPPGIAPHLVAAPELLLRMPLRALTVDHGAGIGPDGVRGELRQLARNRAYRPVVMRKVLCGPDTQQCVTGREMLFAEDRGWRCAAPPGSPVLIVRWTPSSEFKLSTADPDAGVVPGPLTYLAGIVSRALPDGTCVASLITARVANWIVTEGGVAVTECGLGQRCGRVRSGL